LRSRRLHCSRMVSFISPRKNGMRVVSVVMRTSKGPTAQAELTDQEVLPVMAGVEGEIVVAAGDASMVLVVMGHKRMMNVIAVENLGIGPMNASQSPRRSRSMQSMRKKHHSWSQRLPSGRDLGRMEHWQRLTPARRMRRWKSMKRKCSCSWACRRPVTRPRSRSWTREPQIT
jgi:hypothetical protein